MFVHTNFNTESNNKLKVFDDLNLEQVDVPDIPKDIIFPDELNRYLRDKIRYLNHENGMLKKNLSENEVQLKQSVSQVESLNAQLQKYSSVSNGFTSASDVASVKIVELSKKLREKSSEVEVMKTKCSKLEQRIFEMQNEERDKSEVDEVSVKESTPQEDLKEDIKKLQEKLTSTSSKLFEALNSNVQLKNDLKTANKFVLQEVGETFEKLQNTNINWRGRAQIICDLQQKNVELKEKLKILQEKYAKKDSESPVQPKVDKRIESLNKENKNLKNDLQETKKKLDATRARCRVIETECMVTKAKLSTFAESSERDQLLINTLTGQLSSCQNNHNELLKQKQQALQKTEKENQTLSMELARERLKTETLEKEVKSYRQEVERLSGCIRKQSSTSLEAVHNNADKNLNYLEAERSRLLQLISVSNEKLDREREDHSNTQSLYRLERQRVAKLEAKLARTQLDQNLDKCSVYSNSSLSSIKSSKENESMLKDQLELADENIKALQTRLDIEKNERKLDFAEFSRILEKCALGNT